MIWRAVLALPVYEIQVNCFPFTELHVLFPLWSMYWYMYMVPVAQKQALSYNPLVALLIFLSSFLTTPSSSHLFPFISYLLHPFLSFLFLYHSFLLSSPSFFNFQKKHWHRSVRLRWPVSCNFSRKRSLNIADIYSSTSRLSSTTPIRVPSRSVIIHISSFHLFHVFYMLWASTCLTLGLSALH